MEAARAPVVVGAKPETKAAVAAPAAGSVTAGNSAQQGGGQEARELPVPVVRELSPAPWWQGLAATMTWLRPAAANRGPLTTGGP